MEDLPLDFQLDFQYSKIKEDNAKWEKFSKAIKKYQESKGAKDNNADGVISPDKTTQESLERDIRKYLQIENLSEQQNTQPGRTTTVPQ